MYLCYIDESGTPDVPGNSSHFILAGISIPVEKWKYCDKAISSIKKKYDLCDSEIHTAWMLRKYFEQSKIANFDSLDKAQRIYEVERLRNTEILRLQRAKNPKLLKQTKKNYKSTSHYIHLTHNQRKRFIEEVAECVSKWAFAKLFAECVDKIHYNPARALHSIERQSFEQVVSRFEKYLQNTSKLKNSQNVGLLIHDNNETVSKKHTGLMKDFHDGGTFWTSITQIIETPLFVDSQLTSMVQIADLCSYAIRRYLENNESQLFDLIFRRADVARGVVVGVRHFTNKTCQCKICSRHRFKKKTGLPSSVTPPA